MKFGYPRDYSWPPAGVDFVGQSSKKIADWKREEMIRKNYPEAKRARKDKQFKVKFLAKLRREEKKIRYCERTLAGITLFDSELTKRINQLNEILTQRMIVCGERTKVVPLDINTPAKLGAAPLPVICHRVDGELAGLKLNPHCHWSGQAGFHSHIISDQNHESTYGRSGWRTLTRADHRFAVRCFGLIDQTDSRVLHAVTVTSKYSVTLPTGYHWDVDANGLRAVHGPDDHHVRYIDIYLAAQDGPGGILNALAENAKQRKKMAAEKAIEAASDEGVYICVMDSLRAGNCRIGTEQFAIRHGLDLRRHYSAKELLNQANGDYGRVKLAVTAAKIRHNKEMEQGFALLADHGIGEEINA